MDIPGAVVQGAIALHVELSEFCSKERSSKAMEESFKIG